MQRDQKLDDDALAAARYNLQQAKASLACEGLYLTEEEEALFREFEEQRLSHDERRRRLIDFSRSKRTSLGIAAE